jgi:prevent-host-death family protein
MSNFPNILPVSQARNTISDLVENPSSPTILTKRGRAKAVLLDIKYWQQLNSLIDQLTQKTFIDPSLLPFTRKFSDQEIKTLQQGDQL